jgi:hypothetical protein
VPRHPDHEGESPESDKVSDVAQLSHTPPIGRKGVIHAKGRKETMTTTETNQPEKPKAAKSLASVEPAESTESTQKSAIDIKVDQAVEMLKTYASAITVNVHNARTFTESLNPAIDPLRILCRNLGVADNLDDLSNPAISAVVDILAERNVSVNFLQLLEMAQTVQSALPRPDLSKLDTSAGDDISDNLGNLVKASMFLEVGQSTIDAAKLALATYAAAKRDLDGWNNQTNRHNPSLTGTKGPKPTGRGGSGKLANEVGFQVQYECDICGQAGYTGLSSESATLDAIKRHLAESHNEAWITANTPEHVELRDGIKAVIADDISANVPHGIVHRVALTN